MSLKEKELIKKTMIECKIKDQKWIETQETKRFKEYREGFKEYLVWAGETLTENEMEKRCIHAYKNSPQYKIDQLVKKGIKYPKSKANRNITIEEWHAKGSPRKWVRRPENDRESLFEEGAQRNLK